MSKRVKVLVSVLVAVLLLVASGTAIAMAQEEEESAPPVESNGFLARVAEILGIPEEDLIDAFGQARQEMREEVFLNALDKAVEEEIITQEEAGELKEWWAQKPDVLDQGLFGNASRFMGPRADCMLGNRLGVRAKLGPQPWQEMNQQAWQGMGQQPWQGIRQQVRQAIGQRVCQAMNGEFQQLGPSWLAE